MDIEAEFVGSAVILRLEGRMSVECDAGWTRAALMAASGDGVRHVLVDVGRVRLLDCCGLGQLLALRAELHGARKSICLVDVERHQRRMLELAGLLHVFRVFPDCDAAVSALGLNTGARRDWTPESGVPARAFGRGCPEPYWAAALGS
ncbi:MAG TPA: anti-sigma factor antagonist [Vicinamibacterales bacterium]|nr:anti-sigma factor antagonist [Vicinamibacterales bacterium]